VNLIPDFVRTPRFSVAPNAAAMAAQIPRFNEVLARQAREQGAVVVDLYGPSQTALPAHPHVVLADGYHPSDVGYELWSALMWGAIEPRVPPRR
jgi:lysophospholipase L1-like esterase